MVGGVHRRGSFGAWLGIDLMSTKDVTDKMVCDSYALKAKQFKELGDYDYPYETLMARTGECFKVCYAAMERACRHGLIEYGVSLRTGWLTDKGKILASETIHEAD